MVELLIVIAIIGILASIVLVNLSSARTKAKDAAIISSANAIMKAAQINSLSSGDYSLYKITQDTCSSYSASTPNRSSMVDACNSIITNSGTAGSQFKLWMNSWGGANRVKFSVLAWLPGKQKYYCIGSNGGTSMETNSNGTGCGSNVYSCSGCAGDPNPNGM